MVKTKVKTPDGLGEALNALRLLHENGPMHQRSVAEQLGVTVPSAFGYFRRLENEGLIEPVKKQPASGRGRPTMLWGIEEKRNFCIGIALLPPQLLLCVSDFSGNIVMRSEQTISDTIEQKAMLKRIDAFIKRALAKVKMSKGTIRSVSVGVPGHLDPCTGEVLVCANIQSLVGLNLESHIRKSHGLFCRVHSNSYTLYFSEKVQQSDGTTLAVIDWELGLGFVVGCNDQVFTFPAKQQGIGRNLQDIGHMRIVQKGKKCHCGKRGCLEAYCGGWALLAKMKDRASNLEELIALIEKKDAKACSQARDAAKILGEHIGRIVLLLGIDRIVFSGPLGLLFDTVQKQFRAGLRKTLSEEEVDWIAPQASLNPIENIMNGGGYLAKKMFFYPQMLKNERCMVNSVSMLP